MSGTCGICGEDCCDVLVCDICGVWFCDACAPYREDEAPLDVCENCCLPAEEAER